MIIISQYDTYSILAIDYSPIVCKRNPDQIHSPRIAYWNASYMYLAFKLGIC